MKVHTPMGDDQKQAMEDMLRRVLEVETYEDIYEEAERYVLHDELLAMAEDGKLAVEAVAKTYAGAGFIVGFKYALENIEAKEDDEK